MAAWGVKAKTGRRALAAAVLLVLALGISACGGGSGESDEEQVEAAIEAAFTATDSSACGESRTIDFMEETGESTGAEAERECEKVAASREGMPESVVISKVEVKSEKATAQIAFKGGDPDGLVLNATLVEEDGSWKIDDFTELASLDRDVFNAKIEKEFRQEGLGPPEVSCLIAGLDELPQAEYEKLVLSGDDEGITEMTEQCAADIEADRRAAKVEREVEKEELAELEAEAREHEYPRAVQQSFLTTCLATSGANFDVCECSLDSLEGSYTVKELLQAEANIANGRLREMIESAGAACA